jgi:hypothetical protein
MATCGIPLSYSFDPWSADRVFRFEFSSGQKGGKRGPDPVTAPTLIYVPLYQYPNGVAVTVSDGTFVVDAANQVLRYTHDADTEHHEITIRLQK